MKQCVYCGGSINDNAKFCTVCGKEQPEQAGNYSYNQSQDKVQQQNTGYQDVNAQQQNMGYQNMNPQSGNMGYQNMNPQGQNMGYQNMSPQGGNMGYQNTNQYYQQPQVQTDDFQKVRKAAEGAVNNLKSVGGQFTTGVKKMGISVFCMFGIIAAVLFIVAPFMNFASMHFDVEYKGQSLNSLLEGNSYDYDDYSDFGISDSLGSDIDISVSDGLNLFELYDLSDDIIDIADDNGVRKSDLKDAVEEIDAYLAYGLRELNSNGLEVDSDLADEISGTLHLLVNGEVALMITPWIFILCGIAMLIFTVINSKRAKLISMIIALAAFIWLIVCSSHFISMMGVGALAIAVGIILGVISTFKDKPAGYQVH